MYTHSGRETVCAACVMTWMHERTRLLQPEGDTPEGGVSPQGRALSVCAALPRQEALEGGGTRRGFSWVPSPSVAPASAKPQGAKLFPFVCGRQGGDAQGRGREVVSPRPLTGPRPVPKAGHNPDAARDSRRAAPSGGATSFDAEPRRVAGKASFLQQPQECLTFSLEEMWLDAHRAWTQAPTLSPERPQT